MPNSRIWTAGSELEDVKDASYKSGAPKPAIEIYELAWYSITNRAQMTSAPTTISYAEVFTVLFVASGPGAVSRVSLMRFGSVARNRESPWQELFIPTREPSS